MGNPPSQPSFLSVPVEGEFATPCRVRLHMLYEALQAFRRRNGGQLPETLSELYPEYVAELTTFACPMAEASGDFQLGEDFLQDFFKNDGLTNYSYEFTSEQEYHWLPPHKGEKFGTKSEYKSLQMKTPLGPVVPMIRCLRHGKEFQQPSRSSLNLSYDGRVYFGYRFWESTTKALLPHIYAMPGHIFNGTWRLSDRIGARAARANEGMLDLEPYYNALAADSWSDGFARQTLVTFAEELKGRDWIWEVPEAGRRRSISFDARGVIQLDGKTAESKELGFPAPLFADAVTGIPAGQEASTIHVLGGVLYPSPVGSVVATLRLHLRGGAVKDLPIRYGKEVASWQAKPETTPEAQVAWSGKAGPDEEPSPRHVYAMSFPLGQSTFIESIDFISGGELSPPFIMGLTLSP